VKKFHRKDQLRKLNAAGWISFVQVAPFDEAFLIPSSAALNAPVSAIPQRQRLFVAAVVSSTPSASNNVTRSLPREMPRKALNKGEPWVHIDH
jgi:hypothetical protein